MIRKITYSIFVILIFSTIVLAQDVDYLFQQANDAYQQENYQEAINHYKEIIHNGKVSGKLYFNLGNAYYKIDNIGKAILYYEKAKRLIPENESLAFNLKIANVKVQDRIKAPDDTFFIILYKKIVYLFSAFTWIMLISLLIFITALLFFLSTVIKSLSIKQLRPYFFSLLLVAVLILYPAYQKYKTEVLVQEGVILSDVVNIYAAPDSESTKLFNIHEGTVVTILDNDGNWFKIELIDGKQGWLRKEQCGEV